MSPLAHIELGKVLLWARQFDRAQATMEAAFELRPDYWLAAWYRGVALYFQGRIEEALRIWQSVQKKTGATPVGIGSIGMGLGQLGRYTEARAALADLDAAEGQSYVPRFSRAQIHMGLGETDTAFERLDRAVEEREVHILDLPCKPIWDGLRSDPRFTALLHKMRLAQAPGSRSRTRRSTALFQRAGCDQLDTGSRDLDSGWRRPQRRGPFCLGTERIGAGERRRTRDCLRELRPLVAVEVGTVTQ